MIYHITKKRTLNNEFHEKQTQISFRTTSRITYYGTTQKFKFFEFLASVGKIIFGVTSQLGRFGNFLMT